MKHLTQAGYTQIEKVKKVSAWGGHPVRPDLLGTAYGMNFARMPELAWPFGYPFALGLMLVVSLTLNMVSKGRGWLRPGRDPSSSTYKRTVPFTPAW